MKLLRIAQQITVATLFAIASTAQAFDTGAHTDITSAALIDFGASSDAVKVARLSNWLVDYYSNTGSYQHEFELLHFDNLPTTHMCLVYWGHLVNNTRIAMQDAARSNDVVDALVLLGMSLHAVQDFYTHSNWEQLHPANPGEFRADTFFTDMPPDNFFEQAGVYTGKYPGGSMNNPNDWPVYHGNNFWGLNDDNYNRPNYDAAFVFAYSATVQWIRAVYRWVETVNRGFFNRMIQYDTLGGALTKSLNLDMEFLYYISSWTYDPRELGLSNGKWKGWGSGSFLDFLAVTLDFKTTGDDIFIDRFKAPQLLFRKLTPNLNNVNGLIPLVEKMPKPDLKSLVVYLKTTRVRADSNFLDPPLPLENWPPDFYAGIDIGNQRHLEGCLRDLGFDLSPAWRTIKIIPTRRKFAKVNYRLWDEDKTGAAIHQIADDRCDINPAAGKTDLSFTYEFLTHRCTGDVDGIFDNPNAVFTSSGEGSNPCTIWFYITDYKLIDP